MLLLWSDHKRKVYGGGLSYICPHSFNSVEGPPTQLTSSEPLKYHCESNVFSLYSLICSDHQHNINTDHHILIDTFLKLVKSLFTEQLHGTHSAPLLLAGSCGDRHRHTLTSVTLGIRSQTPHVNTGVCNGTDFLGAGGNTEPAVCYGGNKGA